ncbi:MAG TPA: vitamin K epoxide reductase family protein [Pyrinomonadaceae bacterium]|jgi:uncharacterized membrane protein
MRRIIQYVAVVVSIIGLIDAIYLTIHYYTAEPVPCTITGGCEMVLTSAYAEVAGLPLAAFGATAYFIAFALALLTVYGNLMTWTMFGALTLLMAAFSGYLIYVQAEYIHAFCQFCMLSAGTSFTLFILFLVSLAARATPETV